MSAMAPGALFEVPVKTILGEDKPFGEVTDYWVRIEFQGANKD